MTSLIRKINSSLLRARIPIKYIKLLRPILTKHISLKRQIGFGSQTGNGILGDILTFASSLIPIPYVNKIAPILMKHLIKVGRKSKFLRKIGLGKKKKKIKKRKRKTKTKVIF